MKNKLPALTLLLLVVAGGAFGYRSLKQQRARALDSPPVFPVASTIAETTPAEPTAGDELLLQARSQLERRTSVAARLRHQVSLAGRDLAGFGGYWQQGSGDDLRMRLELKFNHEDTTLMQISNGRFLWTDQRLPAGRYITKLDLRRVRNELNRAEEERDELEPGQATWTMIEPKLSIRYGGLPTLLLSLSNCFQFAPPQPMRWTPAPPLEGITDSLPVFAVVGHWKANMRALFLPPGADAQALPERLPQEVLLLFGQSDLFPYRIEFRKMLNPPGELAANGQPAPIQLSRQPLVLMELSAVSFDGQIAAGQFDFSPGDAPWDNRTDEYLEGIRRQLQPRTAAREKELKQ